MRRMVSSSSILAATLGVGHPVPHRHRWPQRSDDAPTAWRVAYNSFIDRALSDAEASTCSTAWTQAIAALSNDPRVTGMAAYYVGYLRNNGGKSPDCLSR
jgi:hypothetical protein